VKENDTYMALYGTLWLSERFIAYCEGKEKNKKKKQLLMMKMQ